MSAAAHVLQSRGNSCVAACVCILRRLRGEQADEPALLARWADRGTSAGYDLDTAAEELGIAPSIWTVNDAALDRIAAHLRYDGWVLAWVGPRVYGPWISSRARASAHGQLGLRPHAVVLCGVDDTGFHLLDPFFMPDGQPIAAPFDDLASFLTGHFLLVGH